MISFEAERKAEAVAARARRKADRMADEHIAAEEREADARVQANEERRLAEARRQIAAADFDRRFKRWIASDVPEVERSIGWFHGWKPEPVLGEPDEVPELDAADDLAAVAPAPVDPVREIGRAATAERRRVVERRDAIAAVVADVRAGIEVTVDEPKRLGGPPRIDVERVRQLAAAGKTASEIATEMGHARESIRCVARRHRITIRRASPSEAGRAGGIAKAAAQEAAC